LLDESRRNVDDEEENEDEGDPPAQIMREMRRCFRVHTLSSNLPFGFNVLKAAEREK